MERFADRVFKDTFIDVTTLPDELCRHATEQFAD
jgi:hypothetical protein